MKIIALTAPKTAGSTILASNLAIAHQWRIPQQKVGLLQLSMLPDLHHCMGLTHKRHLGHLVSFWKTKEWNAELLSQIIQAQGVEVLFSPTMREWATIDQAFFTDCWELITKRYDILYLDLQPTLPSWIWEFLQNKIKTFVSVLSVDPSSFSRYEQLLESHPVLEEKAKIIINQVSKPEASEVKAQFSRLEASLLGTLPPDPRAVWHQIYEGIPVVMQKRSKLGKAIEGLTDSLLN